MATPLTELRLLNNIDLDTTYNNTFSRALFGNLAGQISFFSGKTVYSFTNLTFQRKERTIKVKRAYEDIESLSYGMFKNGTTGKWYFFFIVDYMYVSENVTEIKIEIDVEQTYLFDVAIADSFVEREHVESDGIGEHLIDENLSTGEYTIRATDTFLDLNSQSIVVATTYDPVAGADVVGDIQTGIYQGAAFFAFDRNDIVSLNIFLLALTTAAKADSVVSIFMIPTNLLGPYTSGDKISVPNANVLYYNYPKNTTDIDGYVPKNKKLLTYPYNFLYVSNHNGSFATYRYEFSSATQMEFQAVGNIAPSPIVSLIPRSYKGAVANFDEIFRLADYPLCSWTTDAFLGYLSQNAVSAPLSIASSGLSAAGTLGGIGAAAGATAVGTVAAPIAVGAAVIGIASTIGNFVEAALQSNQLKGSISGGSNTAIGIQTFAFYPKTIRAEQARVIDDFFTKYGYKVNQVKTPNTISRTRHNYLKVQDCILKGNVPREALSIMIQNRTKGITFWHVNDIGNYSLSNGIVGGGSGGGTPEPEEPPTTYQSNSLGFAFPLEQGVSYTLSSPYGERIHPITGEPDFHYGVDLATAEGTDIVSTLDGGLVTSKGYSESMGYYVYIDYTFNGNDYRVIVMHMVTSASVNVGNTVNKGDIIGGVGTTGSSTGNHLHFGLKQNDVYVDPWLFINPNL